MPAVAYNRTTCPFKKAERLRLLTSFGCRNRPDMVSTVYSPHYSHIYHYEH